MTAVATDVDQLRAELDHLRFVETNLRDQLDAARAEVAHLRRTDWVMFDLWQRGVRPGWRMWRVRRRREASDAAPRRQPPRRRGR